MPLSIAIKLIAEESRLIGVCPAAIAGLTLMAKDAALSAAGWQAGVDASIAAAERA